MRISDWSSDVCSSDLGAWRKRRRGCNPDLRRGGLREICPGLLLSLAFLVPASAFAQQVIGEPRLLDGFEDATPWRVVTSNQVSGELRMMEGVQGRALCLDYDFNDVSGYVGLQRDLPIDYPENYAFAFELRGDSPATDREMKFVDASGENVWRVTIGRASCRERGCKYV